MYEPWLGTPVAMVRTGVALEAGPLRRTRSTFSNEGSVSPVLVGVQVMVKAEPAVRSWPLAGAMMLLPEGEVEVFGACWARMEGRAARPSQTEARTVERILSFSNG